MTTFEISEDIDEIIEKFDELMEDEDQLEQAAAFLQAALEQHPEAVALHAAKAELAVEQERYDDAVEGIDAILNDEARELEDDERSNLLSLKAHALFYRGDLDPSRHTFNAALRADFENWTALNGRAMVHDRMGFMVAALIDLDHAVEIDDEQGAPFSLRGMVYLKRGQFEEAERDFGYALESDPFDERSRLNLARLLSLKGMTGEAIETIELLIEQGENPDYLAPGALLRSQLSLTLGSAEAAAEDAQIAIDAWPDKPWGYLQLAACYLTGMKAEEAIKTLKTAEKFAADPRDIPDIFALRANAYEQMDRHDQAAREKKKAEGTARLPIIVYGAILNPARDVPINPDRPIDVRAILADLFGHPNRAPKGYEDALRDIVDKIPEIVADNPGVERIQIELPQVQGMRGGPHNLVIQVAQQQQKQQARA